VARHLLSKNHAPCEKNGMNLVLKYLHTSCDRNSCSLTTQAYKTKETSSSFILLLAAKRGNQAGHSRLRARISVAHPLLAVNKSRLHQKKSDKSSDGLKNVALEKGEKGK